VNESREPIFANYVDIASRRIFSGVVRIDDSRIIAVTEESDSIDPSLRYILPGFIDAHIHIESSMLVPSEFARLATLHGTVATVSDPHEIANVLGVEGVDFMIESSSRVPLKVCFGAPSCVPATAFESAGATIDSAAIEELLSRPEIGYLAEMMNFPGVLYGDEEVLRKLEAARRAGKPVDGHAPGLRGDQAEAYIRAGISTDHECTTLEEAVDKLKHGMKILIREGSAAKNFEALRSLIDSHPSEVMFCSDDKHPDELAEGHINELVKRAVAGGADLFNVLRIACLNPIEHYGMNVGQLRVGDPADFIMVEDLQNFEIIATCIDGHWVAGKGESLIERCETRIINRFDCKPQRQDDFKVTTDTSQTSVQARVIEALDGKLLTGEVTARLPVKEGVIGTDVQQDVLKIVVVNRYRPAVPAVAFIKGFGLKRGAIASSVGHDSHNILAVGVDDESLALAINEVIDHRGGVVACDGQQSRILPLPVAGIMSDRDGEWVAAEYRMVDQFAKRQLGSTLHAPFMTLSFMALLVIPKLKLSDLGLFDGEHFQFVSVV
jgi:adenine deaminase